MVEQPYLCAADRFIGVISFSPSLFFSRGVFSGLCVVKHLLWKNWRELNLDFLSQFPPQKWLAYPKNKKRNRQVFESPFFSGGDSWNLRVARFLAESIVWSLFSACLSKIIHFRCNFSVKNKPSILGSPIMIHSIYDILCNMKIEYVYINTYLYMCKPVFTGFPANHKSKPFSQKIHPHSKTSSPGSYQPPPAIPSRILDRGSYHFGPSGPSHRPFSIWSQLHPGGFLFFWTGLLESHRWKVSRVVKFFGSLVRWLVRLPRKGCRNPLVFQKSSIILGGDWEPVFWQYVCQIGLFPQIKVKIKWIWRKKHWNHHLVIMICFK